MDWHYQDPRTGERRGPTSPEVMADKFRRGELDGDSLVWRDGLASWQLASQTADFAGHVRRATPPPLATATPAGGSIGYFAPRADTPPRARENLGAYAPPTGPVGEWPLSDEHVVQFSEAVRLRKRILASYGLIRLVVALETLVAIVMLMVGVTALVSGGRTATEMGWQMLIPGVAFAGFAGLGFACARATWYCRAWGSLVWAILTTVGGVLQAAGVLFVAAAVGSSSSTPGRWASCCSGI